jgi:hypothetical protein
MTQATHEWTDMLSLLHNSILDTGMETRLLVMSMDHATDTFCRENNLDFFPWYMYGKRLSDELFDTYSRKMIERFRIPLQRSFTDYFPYFSMLSEKIHILLATQREGYNILFCDLDIILCKNPIPIFKRMMNTYPNVWIFSNCDGEQSDHNSDAKGVINTGFMLWLNTPSTRFVLEEVFWALHMPYDPYSFEGPELLDEQYFIRMIVKRHSRQQGGHVARCLPPHLDGNACQFNQFYDATSPLNATDGREPVLWHAVCMNGKERKKRFLMDQKCSRLAAQAIVTGDSSSNATKLAAYLEL